MEKLLNLAIFLPLLGAIAVGIVRKEKFSKLISLAISFVVFLIMLYLFVNFDWSLKGFQYITKVDWIPSLGISYHVGVDGMAISLLLMTSLVFLVAFLWSWKIEDRPNLYFALFLALETACLGVFSA